MAKRETKALENLYWVIALLVIGVAYEAWSKASRNRKINKAFEEVRIAYEDALQSGDKALALRKGREYYAFHREGGVSTIYDEQAIQNDLSTVGDSTSDREKTYIASAKSNSKMSKGADDISDEDDDDLQSKLIRFLKHPTYEAFIVHYSDSANVYVQGLKSGGTIKIIEATSDHNTDTLDEDAVGKLRKLGWSISKVGDNFTHEISIQDFQNGNLVSLISQTFSCYKVPPLQVKIKFEAI